MSIHEFFPTPDEQPEDPEAALREMAEFDLALEDLLTSLHLVRDAAVDSDGDRDHNFDQLGQLSGSVEKHRYFAVRDDETIMPCLYEEMRWEPEPHTETAVSVDHIFVRHPRLTEPMYRVMEGSMLTPNDVFVEIVYRNGDNQRILLNDAGLTPYTDGEALDFTDSEILDIERDPQDKPNAFVVSIPHPFAPPVTLIGMNQMILRDSKLRQGETAA
jgi:hypothetical protein